MAHRGGFSAGRADYCIDVDDRLLRCLVPPGGQAESIAMAESTSSAGLAMKVGSADDFILWGDSHAAAFAHAFSGWASHAGLRGILAVMQDAHRSRTRQTATRAERRNAASSISR